MPSRAPTMPRERKWVVVAAAIVTTGLVLTVFGTHVTARTEADRSRRSFETTAEQIAANLKVAVRHQENLLAGSAAVVMNKPGLTSADMTRWISLARVRERYPEVQFMGLVVPVPRDQLAAFSARATTGVAGPTDAAAVRPPGDRPVYCFAQASTLAMSADLVATDYCEGASGKVPWSIRDSGVGSYLPFTAGTNTRFLVQTPVYRFGAPVETVAERRAAFIGWFATGIDIGNVLRQALHGYRGITVAMDYRSTSSRATFRSGPQRRPVDSHTLDLHNGWTATVHRPAADNGILANGHAVTLLIGGTALTALLAALMLLQGRGRARAEFQALHDGLSGLANRALVADRADQLVARSHRNGTQGAALFLDIDGFKNVNDSLGHEAGDRLLAAVGARLTSAVRQADTIGRMGGDEFVILLDGSVIDAGPELVAQRLLDVLREPFDLGGSTSIRVSASIGVASGDRSTGGELIDDADVAMYAAKRSGKDRYVLFDPEMQSALRGGIELEFDLRSALEKDQFHLVYQPVYRLKDGELIGVEALLRWNHPWYGTVGPDAFIPILEKTGQIVAVGAWVLDEACRQMAEWHSRGRRISVAVNVSGRQFDNDDIVERVRSALSRSTLDAAYLTIEVTESSLMRNVEHSVASLRALRDLGARVAIDDFGTGYSSLAYLQQLPADTLKIDRSFISGADAIAESGALVHTIVQLAKELGLKTLAEGVETSEQADQLRADDVDDAQGFFFARPLDPATLEATILRPGILPVA
jgi:diguanylate cyclase (GGDEF)-like protein